MCNYSVLNLFVSHYLHSLSQTSSTAGFIYRVSQNRTRTREVDLLDGFQKAHNLRSIIGIFQRGSVSSISVTGSTTSTTKFFKFIFVNHHTLRMYTNSTFYCQFMP